MVVLVIYAHRIYSRDEIWIDAYPKTRQSLHAVLTDYFLDLGQTS
jgi:hypothetical protein